MDNGYAGCSLLEGVHVVKNIITSHRRYNFATLSGLLPSAQLPIFINHFHVQRTSCAGVTLLLVLTLVVVIFMVLVSLVLLVIGPVMLLQPKRRTLEWYRERTSILAPGDLQLPAEPLRLQTKEGFAISGWLIPAQNARGTVIIMHGVSESKIAGLPMAKELYRRGYNVCLYDSRCHGESGGKLCTYGYHERHDAVMVIDYLLSRTDLHVGKIGLFGWSMGAAVAIQVAAIDTRVAAVVAESSFASLRTVFDDYQRRMIKLPWHYLRNIVIKRSEYLAKFKANDVAPAESVKNVHVPIFLLHGTEDNLVKHSYSEKVFAAANEPKELWLIPGARHHDMMEVGGEEYTRRITEFFDKYLR